MRYKFNQIKALAESKNVVLEDCLVGPWPYKTYLTDEGDTYFWKTLDDVENGLDNISMIADINWFLNRG